MGILFAILAAVCAAAVVILTKAGLKDINSNLAFAIQAVLILVITWGIVLWEGVAGEVNGLGRRTWLLMLGAGVCTTLSTVFSYKALKAADATLVVPIERLSLVIAVVLAAVFLKEKLTWQVAAGAALMTGGAIVIGLAKR